MWKQYTWKIFHLVASNYDETYKNKYDAFFNTFKIIIPCGICRRHFIQNISKPGFGISENMTAEKIFPWTIELHNTVNRMHNKMAWKSEIAKNVYNQDKISFDILKTFIYEYFFFNYKRSNDKTMGFLNMLRNLAYVYPNKTIRDKLIDFTSKFELNQNNAKKWLYAYLIIIKNG